MGTDPRHSLGNASFSPGPIYNPTQSIGENQLLSPKPNAPRTRIGTARRDNHFSGSLIGPSPQSYDTSIINSVGHNAVTRPRSAITKIGKSTRNALYSSTQTPGPDAYSYSIDTVKTSAPRSLMGKSSRDQRSSYTTPSAQDYNVSIEFESTHTSLPRTKVGKAERFSSASGSSSNGINTPGPNQYDISLRHHIPLGRIGTSARQGLSQSTVTPGPSYYDVETSQKAVLPTSPRAKIGTESRDSLSRTLSAGPGPSHYNTVPTSLVKTSPVRVIMGKAPRQTGGSTLLGPGPQTYAPESSTFSVKPKPAMVKIGTASRLSLSSTAASNPGPQSYSVQMDAVKTSAPRTRIGTAARDSRPNSSKVSVPGPMDYHPEASTNFDGRKPNAPRTRIGSAARFGSTATSSSTPGPGYNVQNKDHIPGGAFGRNGRNTGGVSYSGPGPQDYHSSINFESTHATLPRTKVGKAERFSNGLPDSTTPAPNQYMADTASLKVRGTTSPAFRFGTQSRGSLSHDLNSSLYDISQSVHYTKPSPPKTRIGSAPRFPTGSVVALPGPQDYSVNGLSKGPAFTIRAR